MENLNFKDINTTALAYMGDGVYEVYIREYLLKQSNFNVDALHKRAVSYVSAIGQCKVMKALLQGEMLTLEETSLCRRAKNRKIASKPHNVDAMTYKFATAFEALIGMLYVDGRKSRMEEIIQFAIGKIEEENE